MKTLWILQLLMILFRNTKTALNYSSKKLVNDDESISKQLEILKDEIESKSRKKTIYN